jgi:hypothetical protein
MPAIWPAIFKFFKYNNMNIVNIKVTFKDVVSGCLNVKYCTRSEDTFLKMKKGIGSIVHDFDKKNQIHWEWKVIKVEKS